MWYQQADTDQLCNHYCGSTQSLLQALSAYSLFKLMRTFVSHTIKTSRVSFLCPKYKYYKYIIRLLDVLVYNYWLKVIFSGFPPVLFRLTDFFFHPLEPVTKRFPSNVPTALWLQHWLEVNPTLPLVNGCDGWALNHTTPLDAKYLAWELSLARDKICYQKPVCNLPLSARSARLKYWFLPNIRDPCGA